MEGLRVPAELDLSSSNKEEAWKKFEQRFKTYATASGLSGKSGGVQVATLLHVVGEDGQDLHSTFTYGDDEDRDDLNTVMEKFRTYLTPRKNETMERFMLLTRKQHRDEPFEEFYADLCQKAKQCSFPACEDSIVRDCIVLGVQDPKLQRQLLSGK